MRLIAITAVLLVILATVIGALTNATYSFAPTSMCLQLLPDSDGIRLTIHTDSGLMLRRQANILARRSSLDNSQESPDERFVTSVTGTGSSQKLWIFDRHTGKSEILTQGIRINYFWSADSRTLRYEQLSFGSTPSYAYYLYGLATIAEQGNIVNHTFTFEGTQHAYWLPNSRGLAYVKDDLLYLWVIEIGKWASIKLSGYGSVTYNIHFYQTVNADQLIMTYWKALNSQPAIVVLSLTDMTSREVRLGNDLAAGSSLSVLMPSEPQMSLAIVVYQTQDSNVHQSLVDSASAQVLRTLDYDPNLPVNLTLWSKHGVFLYTFALQSDGNNMLLQQYDLLNKTEPEPIIRNIPLRLRFGAANTALALSLFWAHQQLFAITEHEGRYDLILLNLSDGTLTTLLRDKQLISPPQWSPNNRYLIAVWTDDDGSGMVVLDEQIGIINNTRLSTQLGNSYFDATAAIIWLGNGALDRAVLTFRSANTATSTFQLVNLSSGSVIPLADISDQFTYLISQSNDRATFWIESGLPDQHHRLSEYDGNGNLTTSFIGPERGAWKWYQLSPDGKRLLMSYPAATYLLDSQTGLTKMLNGVFKPPSLMSWSPDGTQFMIADSYTLMLFAADGTFRYRVQPPTMPQFVAWNAC